MERSSLFPFTERELYLFSGQGFTKSVLEAAEGNKHLHLLTYEDMWKDYFGAHNRKSIIFYNAGAGKDKHVTAIPPTERSWEDP